MIPCKSRWPTQELAVTSHSNLVSESTRSGFLQILAISPHLKIVSFAMMLEKSNLCNFYVGVCKLLVESVWGI